MTNKKICLALVVAALVCGIILPACKDDPTPGAGDLVGKWGEDGELEFEFKAGGEFAFDDGEDAGTYSTSGSTLTIIITYEDHGETHSYSCSGTFKFDGFDTLILSGDEFEEEGFDGTYTRIK